MDFRLTVRVGGSPSRDSDVWVSTAPDAQTGRVLDQVLAAVDFASGSVAAVEGVRLDSNTPVAESGLHDGVTLTVGSSDRGARPVSNRVAALWLLVCSSGAASGSVYELSPGVHQLGRSKSSDLVVDDPEISRRQFALEVTPDQVRIRDLGSTNGTTVDGIAQSGAWRQVSEGELINAGSCDFELRKLSHDAAAVVPDGLGGFVLNRTFRILPEAAQAVVEFPRPAPSSTRRPFPWLATLLPLVVAVGLAGVLRQPTFLLFAFLSPVTMLASQFTERRLDKAQRREADAEYQRRREAAESATRRAIVAEAARWSSSFPAPNEALGIVGTPLARLWERRPEDKDFLNVRLGQGVKRSTVTVRVPEGAEPISTDVSTAPISVDIIASRVLGLTGTGQSTNRTAGWVVFQLAALHSPEDVRIVVLALGATKLEWGFLRWLPHALDRATGTVQLGQDDATIETRVKELTALVDERAARRRESFEAATSLVLPTTVVVLDRVSALRRRPAVAALLKRGPDVGVFFVCIDSDPRLLPEECKSVAVIEATGLVHLRVAGPEPETDFRADAFDPVLAERVARTIAPVHRVAGEGGGALPTSLRLLDLMGIPVPDPAQILSNWHIDPSNTKVAVGVGEGGRYSLDIAKDGPHILVAGTTGSGKSEFLQSMVAALAAANAPEELSFLFIDFKGGAAFRAFEPLPHTVGFVTNLDGRLVQRALTALRAELDRRQIQLNTHGAEDVSEYSRRRSQNPHMAPFPRLVIVIDEFAEMKEQLPGFVDGLVAIARVGRSLGVHLVLATQRPHGVVSPEIRSNANLRICLRVREDSDSIDVLDSAAAASIPRSCPGRAYASIGGESIQLFQAARVAGRAQGTAAATTHVWPAPWEKVGLPRPRPVGSVSETTDMEVLVSAIVAAAKSEGRVSPYRPWTPPLPACVDLARISAAKEPDPGLIIGLRDLPSQQRQSPWTLRLGHGHLAVVGGSRSGRTTTLRTLAVSLAQSYDVPDVHFWAVDGGQGLHALARFPHCGVVVPVSDLGRIDRLLQLLELEVERRLRLLAADGYANLDEQRDRADEKDRMPFLVLLVDRWEVFVETFGNTATADRMRHLLDGGATVGLTIAVAGDESLLHSRTLDRFAHRLVLHLNDPSNAAMAGLDPKMMPAENNPGRGIIEDGSVVQVALLSQDPSGQAQTRALNEEISAAVERDTAHAGDPRRPFRLQALPTRVSLSSRQPATDGAVIGVCGDDAGNAVVQPQHGMLVVGPRGSGRSTALATTCLALSNTVGQLLVMGDGPVWQNVLALPNVARMSREEAQSFDWRNLKQAGAPVVVIDDLDRSTCQPLLDTLASGVPLPLIASADLGAFAFPSQPMRSVLRASRTIVLLCPPDNLQANYVGVRIERGKGFTGPAGRGIPLCVRMC